MSKSSNLLKCVTYFPFIQGEIKQTEVSVENYYFFLIQLLRVFSYKIHKYRRNKLYVQIYF